MAEYIQITLNDFEEQFNIPHKKNPDMRAFELHRPKSQEAYYRCKLYETEIGVLYLQIYTSIRGDRQKARDVGKDAIRIILAWEDKEDNWFKCLGKGKRVYRSGGKESTAKDVVRRALERSREVAKSVMDGSGHIKKCPNCSRPMVPRQGPTGNFYGCIGYMKDKICTVTKPMSH